MWKWLKNLIDVVKEFFKLKKQIPAKYEQLELPEGSSGDPLEFDPLPQIVEVDPDPELAVRDFVTEEPEGFERMELLLSKLPPLRGIYDGKVPRWAHYLYPEAAASLMRMEEETGGLIYTSVWRSANASLWAIKNKKGALPPGFSGHNYGLAVDLTIDWIEEERGWNYQKILDFMEEHGWYCHRRDRRKAFENWHFNYFGDQWPYYKEFIVDDRSRTWHLGQEQQIQDLYSNQWDLTTTQVQHALAELKFYEAEVDGVFDQHSIEALNAFQRAYKLKVSRTPSARDKRTLAFCTATKRVVKIPGE